MSNRVFKKVYGDRDKSLDVTPDSEDEAPVQFSTKAKSVKNPYELLGDDLSESEAKEDDNVTEDLNANSADSSKALDTASHSKKKKKKKKAIKKKHAVEQAAKSTKDTKATEDEDSVKQGTKSASSFQSKENVQFERLFAADSRYFNPEFELRKIFGSKVINFERGKGQRRIYRPNKLIAPNERWAPAAGSGISMSFLENRDGFLYFKFEHDITYRETQKQFLDAVNSLNPDNIMSISRRSYHIDSNIQFSDMAKSAEDMKLATELIEGALYCMENVFHSRFNLGNPCCRLEYKYQENRSFFILLFKHLTFVGQRACHKTAFELCKRLLCLDPEGDPLCATLMIDFYAIKASEYEWLIKLNNFWENSKNLSQLPNFAYSVALANYLLSEEKGKSNENYLEKSNSLLQYALLMFPYVLLPLLDRCGVQCDSRAKNHAFFNYEAQNSSTKSLKLLCELYAWRTHHVWRETSVLSWLEKNVHLVLDKVDKKDSLVKDYEAKRKRRYQGTPRNILRHVILTDHKDLTVNLPADLAKEPIYNFDPLPPLDSIDIYKINAPNTSDPEGSGQRDGVLSMLVRSIFYDLNVPGNQNAAAQQIREQMEAQGAAALPENLQAAAGAGAGLQQSLTTLMDAMRDLLSNVNPVIGGGDAEGMDGDESEDADD